MDEPTSSNPKKSNKKLLTILLLILIAALAAFGVWYFNYNGDKESNITQVTQQTTQQENQKQEATFNENGTSISYDGIDEQSALSILEQLAEVKTEEFTGIGEYVVSINGIEADSTSNFWAFYVNGEQAQVGAADYITKSSDKIEWRLEDVTAFEE